MKTLYECPIYKTRQRGKYLHLTCPGVDIHTKPQQDTAPPVLHLQLYMLCECFSLDLFLKIYVKLSSSSKRFRSRNFSQALPQTLFQAISRKNIYSLQHIVTGPTYIWTFNLRTKAKPSKWVLAGVAMLLQI